MLGSNQCGQYTNNYIALIIVPFAVASIALVAFVIALNLTVSVYTVNDLYSLLMSSKYMNLFSFLMVPFLLLISSFLD